MNINRYRTPSALFVCYTCRTRRNRMNGLPCLVQFILKHDQHPDCLGHIKLSDRISIDATKIEETNQNKAAVSPTNRSKKSCIPHKSRRSLIIATELLRLCVFKSLPSKYFRDDAPNQQINTVFIRRSSSSAPNGIYRIRGNAFIFIDSDNQRDDCFYGLNSV